MYLLSFLAVVIVSLLAIGTTSMGIGAIGFFGGIYLDYWSFGILILLCVPILIGSGLFKDFNNAFRLAVKIKEKTETEPSTKEKIETEAEPSTKKKRKSEASLTEVKHAIEAVCLVRKVLVAGGAFIMLLTFTFLLACSNSDFYAIGADMAVALLPLIYAFAIDIFLLPMEARLKVKLNDMMHQ